MKIHIFFQDRALKEMDVKEDFCKFPITVPAEEGLLKITFSVPIMDMQGYWIPSLRAPGFRLLWNIESCSAGQKDFPFLSFFNTENLNRFSVATTDLTDDTKITARMNQEKQQYDITISVAIRKDSSSFELILDQRPQLWTEILAAWRKELDLPHPAFPPGAWEPVFCTWYAVHGAVTQDWVDKIAPIIADLGFKTLIIDDGWCFDEMKRVSPQTISSWYEWIGDWELSQVKFPDFKAHRERIRELGLQYLFWVTPFLIGEKSRFRKNFPDSCGSEYHEGCYVFRSKEKEASNAMLDKLQHVIKDHDLDGLKIDFLDYILPDIEKPEGRTATEFIRRLSGKVREVRQDALIEFRQSYATPGMMAYGTQFRAGDVPFDFIDNFLRLAQIRISMGDGIPIHADPAYWHSNESAMNISRHMIASLAGVPMLSMDMASLSDMEYKIIKHWLGFYKLHLDTFRQGKWKVHYSMNNLAFMRAAGEKESIIFLLEPTYLQEALASCADHKVIVLNLAGKEIRLPGGLVTDEKGEYAGKEYIPAGCAGFLGYDEAQ